MAKPERWAALDIGSDTVHLLIAEVTRGPGRAVDLRQVAQRVDLLELGRATATDRALSRATIRRLARTVRSFAAVARRSDARLIAAATEAIRQAANGGDVLRALDRAAGVPVHLLSGTREAELGFLAARPSLAGRGAQLLIDSGGASTEVSVTAGRRLVSSRSIPVGAASLAARLPGDPPHPLPWALEAVRIAEANPPLPRTKPARAFATGGTAHNLVGLDLPRKGPADPVELSMVELERLSRDLLRRPAARIAKVSGEDPRRVALLAPGTLILAVILRHYRLPSVTVIPAGVRDGMILAAVRHPDTWWLDAAPASLASPA